jgi:hypothetical protein
MAEPLSGRRSPTSDVRRMLNMGEPPGASLPRGLVLPGGRGRRPVIAAGRPQASQMPVTAAGGFSRPLPLESMVRLARLLGPNAIARQRAGVGAAVRVTPVRITPVFAAGAQRLLANARGPYGLRAPQASPRSTRPRNWWQGVI